MNLVHAVFCSKRRFGIELEFNRNLGPLALVDAIKSSDPKHNTHYSEVYQQDYSNNYWHVKFDRSCGDIKNEGGWEVASYVGKGYKDIDNIVSVSKSLKNAGAKVNNDCGFHIHAEVSDFTHDKMAILVAYWIKIESIMLEMVPSHRRNNKYCKPISKKYQSKKLTTPINFWSVVRTVNSDNVSRRVTLNLCNYSTQVYGKSTIEFRLPEGTNDEIEIKNWLRFYLFTIESLKKKENLPENLNSVSLEEMLEIIGLHGKDPFVILSPGLLATKIWILNRIKKYSSNYKLIKQSIDLLSVITDKKHDSDLIKNMFAPIYNYGT